MCSTCQITKARLDYEGAERKTREAQEKRESLAQRLKELEEEKESLKQELGRVKSKLEKEERGESVGKHKVNVAEEKATDAERRLQAMQDR